MEYCSIENARSYVEEKINTAIDNFKRTHSAVFEPPRIIWRAMGVRRAGYARYSDNSITLNSNYLRSKDWKDFLDDTPLHELAHIIAMKVYGEPGHKKMWKMVCYTLGLKGNRCHNFSTPEDVHIITRKRKTYKAHCECMEHTISSVKYNRIVRGTQTYICIHCRKRLIVD